MSKDVLTTLRASWAVLPALLAPVSALALQPLASFVESARTHNVDVAEATAGLDAANAQTQVSLGRTLPSAVARGVYTRNQFQVGPIPATVLGAFSGAPPNPTLPPVYLQRYNQFNGVFQLNVPLIDLSSFARLSAANSGAESARWSLDAAKLQISSLVASTYFRLVGAQALVAASERALDVAQTNLQLAQARYQAGKGAVLEVDRAKAAVEAQRQQVTQNKLGVALAARALESTTGLAPELSGSINLEDDLHAEAQLSAFERKDEDLPGIQAAVTARESAEGQARAQRFSLLPALSGNVAENGGNIVSFSGQPWSYAAQAMLSWQLDYATFAGIRAQDAAVAAARAREERARLQTHDAIYQAWYTVDAAIAQSRSARAQQAASTHASQLAQDRYESGAATQLDLLQAQKDAFDGDVARIQADASLAFARLQLRLAAGIDPFAPKGTP